MSAWEQAIYYMLGLWVMLYQQNVLWGQGRQAKVVGHALSVEWLSNQTSAPLQCSSITQFIIKIKMHQYLFNQEQYLHGGYRDVHYVCGVPGPVGHFSLLSLCPLPFAPPLDLALHSSPLAPRCSFWILREQISRGFIPPEPLKRLVTKQCQWSLHFKIASYTSAMANKLTQS